MITSGCLAGSPAELVWEEVVQAAPEDDRGSRRINYQLNS